MPDLGSFALEFAQKATALQIVEHKVLEELHGDRAAAPAQAAPQHRCERDEINAAVIHVALILDSDDGLLHRLGDLVRLEHDRAAAIRIPARCGPGHHDLRRGHENTEMVWLEVPESAALGGVGVGGAGDCGQNQSSTKGALHRVFPRLNPHPFVCREARSRRCERWTRSTRDVKEFVDPVVRLARPPRSARPS
jgi:hypothetical protein